MKLKFPTISTIRKSTKRPGELYIFLLCAGSAWVICWIDKNWFAAVWVGLTLAWFLRARSWRNLCEEWRQFTQQYLDAQSLASNPGGITIHKTGNA